MYPKATAHISCWLVVCMKYLIVIEYVCGGENSITDTLFLLPYLAVDNQVLTELAPGFEFFACPFAEVDPLDARTHWITEQQADETLTFVTGLLKRNAHPKAFDIEYSPLLKLYSDVWSQLIIEDDLLKHCNEPEVYTRIVVTAKRHDQVFRSLFEPGYYGNKTSLWRIAKRFYWPRVVADVSAFVNSCNVCDQDRSSNRAAR